METAADNSAEIVEKNNEQHDKLHILKGELAGLFYEAFYYNRYLRDPCFCSRVLGYQRRNRGLLKQATLNVFCPSGYF